MAEQENKKTPAELEYEKRLYGLTEEEAEAAVAEAKVAVEEAKEAEAEEAVAEAKVAEAEAKAKAAEAKAAEEAAKAAAEEEEMWNERKYEEMLAELAEDKSVITSLATDPFVDGNEDDVDSKKKANGKYMDKKYFDVIISFGLTKIITDPNISRNIMYPSEFYSAKGIEFINEVRKLEQKINEMSDTGDNEISLRMKEYERIIAKYVDIIDFKRFFLTSMESNAPAHTSLSFSSRGESFKKMEETYAANFKQEDPEKNARLLRTDFFFTDFKNQEKFELKSLSFNELLFGEKIKDDNKIKNSSLSSDERKLLNDQIEIYDLGLICDNYDCGEKATQCVILNVQNKIKLGLISAAKFPKAERDALIKEVLKNKIFAQHISWPKYYMVGEYKLLTKLENELEKNSSDINISVAAKNINLAHKLYDLIGKEFKGDIITLPIMEESENEEYDDSQYFSANESQTLTMSEVSNLALDELYHGVLEKYISKAIVKDSSQVVTLYKNGIVDKEQIVSCLTEINAPGKIVKTLFNQNVFTINDIREMEKIPELKGAKEYVIKSNIAAMAKQLGSDSNKSDKIYDDLMLNGLITQDKIKEMFFDGTISAKAVKQIVNHIENSDLKYEVRYDKLKFDPEELARLYIQRNLPAIKEVLIKKDELEKYDNKKFEEFYKKFPYLKKELTPEEKAEIDKNYRFQKALFQEKITSEEKKKFINSFDDLILRKDIAVDLYKKGLITKNEGIIYCGTDFEKQCQYIDRVNGMKFNDLSDYQHILKAYWAGRITDDVILEKYAAGKIPVEIYVEVKKGLNLGNALDTKVLENLYYKYGRTGKQPELDNLVRYYKEFEEFNRSKKAWQEINEVQKQFIEKNGNRKVLVAGKSGLFSKETLATLPNEIIIQLIKNLNAINVEAAKYLFRDESNSVEKRNKLEELLQMGKLNHDEVFAILTSVYLGDAGNEEQSKIDDKNMAYLLNKGYAGKGYQDDEILWKSDSEKIEHGTGYKIDENGNVVLEEKKKVEQLAYPIRQRLEFLYALDKGKITITKAGPALMVDVPSKNMMIIETIGKEKGEKLNSNLTDHCTYILPRNLFDAVRNEFMTQLVGDEKNANGKDNAILQYKALIDFYNRNKNNIGVRRFRHTKGWRKNLQNYIDTLGPEDLANLKQNKKKWAR